MTYKCICCGIEKPLEDFAANPTARRGHQVTCRKCNNRKQDARRIAARSKLRAKPEPPKPPVYVPYVPMPELGYTVRNDGHKSIPSRGIA